MIMESVVGSPTVEAFLTYPRVAMVGIAKAGRIARVADVLAGSFQHDRVRRCFKGILL